MTNYERTAEHLVGSSRQFHKDYWYGDFTGDDLGILDVDAIGLYNIPYTPIMYYAEIDTAIVIKAWVRELDEYE